MYKVYKFKIISLLLVSVNAANTKNEKDMLCPQLLI